MIPEEKRQVRNETIDELYEWLHKVVESLDHDTEVYKACSAMANAIRGKKS